jgi:hypothetical protein
MIKLPFGYRLCYGFNVPKLFSERNGYTHKLRIGNFAIWIVK